MCSGCGCIPTRGWWASARPFSGRGRWRPICTRSAAPKLLGRDPGAIERIGRDLTPYIGFSGAGAEARGRSAVDIALWDLLGKATGQPVHQLLGGLCRDRIRTYNTCAGYRYVRSRPDWGTDDWGLEGADEGPYEDLERLPPPR